MPYYSLPNYDVWKTTPPEPSEEWYVGDCEECGIELYDGYDDFERIDYRLFCDSCAEEYRKDDEDGE